jgi:hypothetical protein
MRFPGVPFLLACAAASLAAGCAQPDIYAEPYTTVAPAAFAVPLPVALTVNYAKDGKPNPKRATEIQTALADSLTKAGAFQPVAPAQAGGKLEVTVDDVSGTPKKSLLAGFTATVGHVLVSEPEFTPQGRRTARELQVHISYTPAAGSTLDHAYASTLVTVTNNTQDPTDLVPMQDRKHAELALIGNDLNAFTSELAKSLAPAPPSPP